MGINESVFLTAEVDMISAGIIGLAFILLVIFCVVARKTWGWVDITFAILSFLAGVGAIWGMTEVYSLRTKQVKTADKAEKEYNRVKAELDQAIYGEATSTTYDPGSLRWVSGEWSRVRAGSGRVWSQGSVAAEGNNRVFTFSSPREDVTGRPGPAVLLFAFLETEVEGQKYPAQYIGSVRVESETNETVTISAEALAEPGEFQNPSGTWTLFEKMPLDRHGIFKEAIKAFFKSLPEKTEDMLALESNLNTYETDETVDLDISLFRTALQSFYLTPQLVGLDADSREYESLIDNYAFDGVSMGKIQNWIDANSAGRKTTQFDPQPEEVFILYRFEKNSTKPYAVNANGSVETDGLFTPLGLAVAEDLKADKDEVEFKKGDTVLVDQKTADGYTRGENQVDPFKTTESVTEIDRVYIRQVRDFPYEFADLREQTVRMQRENALVTKNNAIQDKSLADAQAQQRARDALKADLSYDQDYLKQDLATIEKLLKEKSGSVDELRRQIANLEQEIEDSYARLRSLSVDLSKRAFAGR